MYTFKVYIGPWQPSIRFSWTFRLSSIICRQTLEKTEKPMTDLSYPTGKFHFAGPLTDDKKREAIDSIAETPAKLRAAVAGLSPEQLNTPYRPGGWTVRQVTHHVPDSHLNAYVRFKLALTEDEPT